MKTNIIYKTPAPSMTGEQFAEANKLTMVVRERDNPSELDMRFYAHFENAEIKNGMLLHGIHGNGETPEKAIANYWPQISGLLLVLNASSRATEEIKVPVLK